MNINQLRPAKEFACQYGVKGLIYGAPGSGKTPILNTASRPVLCVTEPGMLSMRNSNIPTWQAYDVKSIDEFFDWLFTSAETKNFDTVAVDSISQMAEIYLEDALTGKSRAGNKMHGLAAYGDMATRVMKHMRGLYYTQQKHTYLIAKQTMTNENNINVKVPYFPGQVLPVQVPHLYDEILHLGIQNVPGMGQIKAFRCLQSIDTLARDRTGQLNEFEEPHFGKLVEKAIK